MVVVMVCVSVGVGVGETGRENRNPGVVESVVVYVDGRFKESLDLLATERETVFEMSLRAFCRE